MNTIVRDPGLSSGVTLPPLPAVLPLPSSNAEPTNLRTDHVETVEGPLQPMPMTLPWPPPHLHSLKGGCYLVSYTPSGAPLVTYDGTLRVEVNSEGRTASGDLYQRPVYWVKKPGVPPMMIPVLGPAPSPSAGIPILSRARYRYYLRVTDVLEHFTLLDHFTLGFEMHRYDRTSRTFAKERTCSAVLRWLTPPVGYPAGSQYLAGEVRDTTGAVVGQLTVGWVSASLRKATVEIDRVAQADEPLNNGAGVDWHSIFSTVDWDVTAYVSNKNVTEESGESWSDAECHHAMLEWRDAADLDTNWRYHLLCVRRLDSTERGLMYDAYGTDSNNVPREGAAIACNWMFPGDAMWGDCRNKRFGACAAPYFRTAVHETGHATLMYHPMETTGNEIMQVTPQIADNATPACPFPNNIEWHFSEEDAFRLRHLPDEAVRPGGSIRFGESYAHIPVSSADMAIEMPGIELKLRPTADTVPIGAPVRIDLEMTNTTSDPLPAPAKLSMKSGQISGFVTDPAGVRRTFRTVVRYVDCEQVADLQPATPLTHAITLLRGADGALFPTPGLHGIQVDIQWLVNGVPVRVSAETTVHVGTARDEKHAEAARCILSAPDALLTLALGGDHLEDGIAAVKAGIDNPVLHPHFAYIEAKRAASPFRGRKADLAKAAELIDETTVMSAAEIAKAADWVQAGISDAKRRSAMANNLRAIADRIDAPAHVKERIKAL